MAELAGKTLVRKNGDEVSADDALKDKTLVLYYFSAHWCPPCRMFTPVLADFYQEAVDDGAPIEIVFVSSDKSEQEMFQYLKEAHGEWLSVKYGDSVTPQLKQKYGITGIPSLVVVKKDGTLVTKEGKAGVQTKGTAALKDWLK